MLKKFAPFLILALYSLIAILFLKGVLFTPGILMGGDWGFPLTRIQMERFFHTGFYTWSDREILGSEQFFLNILPFQLLIGLLAKFNVTGDIYSKALLFFVFVMPAFSMYLLCRFLKCSRISSMMGGFIFMSLPFFFNYAAMGWLFVLFSMGILPIAVIFFIKSVEENKIHFALLVGMLYTIAMVQSQTFIWYPLTFLCLAPYLITNKKNAFFYFRNLLLILTVFLLLNSHWYLPMFIGGGKNILNNNLGASSVSLGTWSRLSPQNILRGWGSLYNAPYETSTYNNLAFLSFGLPFTAYSSVLMKKRNRLIIALCLLSFIPIVLYQLGPSIIVKFPFSDLIRDVARFSVISSFSYVVLATLVIDTLLRSSSAQLKLLGISAFVLIGLSTYPFWLGGLYGKILLGQDIRLRTYIYPQEDINIENRINNDKRLYKVLYLPIMGELSLLDDTRFLGIHEGIRDIMASYSPKPGNVGLSDRLSDVTTSFIQEISDETSEDTKNTKVAQLLDFLAVKYIVVRKNIVHPFYESITGKRISNLLKKDASLTLVHEDKFVALFENKNALPQVYVPLRQIESDKDISALPQLASDLDEKYNSAIIFNNQNSSLPLKNNFFGKLTNFEIPKNIKILNIKKINPTKYLVKVYSDGKPFTLVFSESFQSNWKLYINNADTTLSDSNHFVVNGYANAWLVNNLPKGYSTFTIEFSPQRLFNVGSIITLSSWLLLTLIVSGVEVRTLLWKKKSKTN